jgi:hypothetical protein
MAGLSMLADKIMKVLAGAEFLVLDRTSGQLADLLHGDLTASRLRF